MDTVGTDGRVLAICISEKKGTRKKNITSSLLIPDFGIEGDAHAGNWHRQVSFLGIESISKVWEKGLNVNFGDFAENITTEGIDLKKLPVGARIKIGNEAILEISQLGKECHKRCAIYYQAGDCIMPKDGVFARVISGGKVSAGDKICIEQEF